MRQGLAAALMGQVGQLEQVVVVGLAGQPELAVVLAEPPEQVVVVGLAGQPELAVVLADRSRLWLWGWLSNRSWLWCWLSHRSRLLLAGQPELAGLSHRAGQLEQVGQREQAGVPLRWSRHKLRSLKNVSLVNLAMVLVQRLRQPDLVRIAIWQKGARLARQMAQSQVITANRKMLIGQRELVTPLAFGQKVEAPCGADTVEAP